MSHPEDTPGAPRGATHHLQRIIRLALLPDEVACYDSDDGQWYGVKDGDHEEWRNVRPLGIFGDGEPGRNCDTSSACGEFSDGDGNRESRPCAGCDWSGCPAESASDTPTPTKPEDRERYYDEQIAPRLREIADMCKAVDMPMVASVYFHEEYSGITRFAPNGDNPSWWLMQHAWHARGNVDAMMMAIVKRVPEENDSSIATRIFRSGKHKAAFFRGVADAAEQADGS